MTALEKNIKKEFENDNLDKQMDLERQLAEIKNQRLIIKLNMQKKFGILPSDLDGHDICMSIQEGDKHIEDDADAVPDQENISLASLLVVSKYKPLYIIEHFLFVVCCLISPYIYGWFVVFGRPE